jgi:hypothetical protein
MSHLLFGLVWVGMLGANDAAAAQATARFCVVWDLRFADAWELMGSYPAVDDHWNTPGGALTPYTEPAAGLRYAIVSELPGGGVAPVQSGWLEQSGVYAGCTPLLTLDSANTYDVNVVSRAVAAGDIVEVRDAPDTASLYAVTLWNNFRPVSGISQQSQRSFHDPLWSDLLAVAWKTVSTFSPDGLQTIRLYPNGESPLRTTDPVDGSETCSYPLTGQGSSRNCGGEIFVKSSHLHRRYAISHELGHTFWNRRVGATMVDADYAGRYPYGSHGVCPAFVGTHSLQEVEYAGLAISEGWAHFVAAGTWNDPDGEGCWFRYWNNLDWDPTSGLQRQEDGLPETSFSGQYEWFDCAGTPGAVTLATGRTIPPGNFVGEYCGVEDEFRGLATEFDWMRMWWDVRSAGFGNQVLLDLIEESAPLTWSPTNAGVAEDQPAWRLKSAAVGNPLYSTWVLMEVHNGVAW